jgi:hypothetical protein
LQHSAAQGRDGCAVALATFTADDETELLHYRLPDLRDLTERSGAFEAAVAAE